MINTIECGLRGWATMGICVLVAWLIFVTGVLAEDGERTAFRPERPWFDTEGVHINAHGFCVLKHEGKYYWYGSHKIEGKTESEKNEAGVRCYVSGDLLNWKNSGMVFWVDAEGQHPDVATASGPLGPFEYRGKFTGAGSESGSGDFAIHQKGDGSLHHIAVRKPDKVLVCCRLTEDGLKPAGEYVEMKGITRATEAPAVMTRGGKIYLLGSGSTGWDPNPARMFVANQIEGPYRSLGNPCVGVNPHNRLGLEKAFGGQSTFLMAAPWNPDKWIAMFDIWNPKEPIKAGYIWLPVKFEDGRLVIRWQNEWKPGVPGPKGIPNPGSGIPRDAHLIAVNQVGYEMGRPKRFTVPLTEDGVAFVVRPAKGGDVLFRSEIHGNIGDFSGFKGDAGEYVIEVSGGKLKPGVSDPFMIHPDLWKEHFWQGAVDFLIDTRSVVGTHPSAFGGCPWRDGTYYDAILPALVLFQCADSARVAAMPRQMDWEADKKRVLSPDFKFDSKNPCSEGVMDTVRKYFTELEPPAADAPDVVKLIHWGAGYYLINPVTKDPSNDPDPRQIHAQTVEQVAYVVWAWPALKEWLPKTFYQKCRDFCVANWAPSLGIGKRWDPKTYLTIDQVAGHNPMGGLLHPYKGRHAPGHSIGPNLLMHEVATRDGLVDPDRYLAAACVVDDEGLKSRTRELAVSHADAVFGRNPRLAASPSKPEMGFVGIERGWPISHKLDTCARLELCRSSISAAPGSEMFPFNPDGPYRHAEGWVNYGAAWCLSLAYFEFDRQGGKAH